MKRLEFLNLAFAYQKELLRRLDGEPIGEPEDSFAEVIEAEQLEELSYDSTLDVVVVCDNAQNRVGALYDADGPMIHWF